MTLTEPLLCAALIALVQQTDAPAPAPKTFLTVEVSEIPMDHSARVPTVEVMVHGEGTFRFAIDTGASGHGRIDNSLVERFGLKEVGTTRASDGTGKNDRTATLVGVDSIRLGDASFEGLTLLAGDYQRLGRSVDGEPTVGILGFGLFAELLLTLDFPGDTVRLTRGELSADDPHTVAYDGGATIASVGAKVGDFTFPAHIDTGNMGGFMLPSTYLEQVEIEGELVVKGRAATTNNEFEIKGAPLAGALEFAGHRLEKPEATFIDILKSANLGHGVLSNFALTIDQKNHRIRFEKPGDEKLAVKKERPRLGIMGRPTPDGMQIDSVIPDTPAARAGIRAGDLLVEVGGESVAQLVRTNRFVRTLQKELKHDFKLVRGAETLVLVVDLTPPAPKR